MCFVLCFCLNVKLCTVHLISKNKISEHMNTTSAFPQVSYLTTYLYVSTGPHLKWKMTLCACVCIRFRKVQCSLWDYLLSVGTRQRERNMNWGQREAPGGSEDPTERTERLHQSPLSARTSHHRRCSTSSFTSRRPSVHPLSASQHLKCVSAMCLCRLCTVCKLFTFILSASSSKVCVRVYIRHILSSPLIKSQTHTRCVREEACWDTRWVHN